MGSIKYIYEKWVVLSISSLHMYCVKYTICPMYSRFYLPIYKELMIEAGQARRKIQGGEMEYAL